RSIRSIKQTAIRVSLVDRHEKTPSGSVEASHEHSPHEKIVSLMSKVNPRSGQGDAVSIPEMRKSSGVSSSELDKDLQAAASLAGNRAINLHRFDRPHLISDAERSQMLKIGNDYFNAASLTDHGKSIASRKGAAKS